MSQSIAKILALFITDAQKNLIPCKHLELDEKGVIGDKHYDHAPITRSVLITSTKAYDILSRESIQTPHGSLGENIVIDYDLHLLNPGDRLQIGDAIVEITQNCTLCNHLATIDKRVPRLLRHDRGIFAKVLQSGTLRLGDEVYLLK